MQPTACPTTGSGTQVLGKLLGQAQNADLARWVEGGAAYPHVPAAPGTMIARPEPSRPKLEVIHLAEAVDAERLTEA